MSIFDNAFKAVIGQEGGYTSNPADAGNWTGGKCYVGQCNGTKYGISAASYPSLNIVELTLAEAQDIYRREYWNKIAADNLPPALALLVFDAAVNSGPDRAIKWLQSVLNIAADGVVGPITLAAARQSAGRGAAVLAEYQAQRLIFLTGLPTWHTFGLGWARRVCTVQFEALRVGDSA